MCQGVLYWQDGVRVTTYFTEPGARLMVQMRQSMPRSFVWGRRLQQPGHLPYGGIVLGRVIESSLWQSFFPKPVKLKVQGFFLRDLHERMRYYRLVNGQMLQGLLACYLHEVRIYIVVDETKTIDALHTYWPRIIYQNRYANKSF